MNRPIDAGAGRRPVPPSAPPLPAFDVLDRTHVEMLQMLGQLTRLLDLLDANGIDASAREMARAAGRFFADTAQRHHADEESLVFPGLLASDEPDLVQHVRRLQQDHGWLEEDWIELAPQLQAVAEGHGGYDLDHLRHAVRVFDELYREHIALEETLIYPEARRRQRLADAAAQARDRSG